MTSEQNSKEASAGSAKPGQLRIFIAVPEDLPLERMLAREAIRQINRSLHFSRQREIEIISWDLLDFEFMPAGMAHLQAKKSLDLTKPEDCDLVVFVLWSRVGRQLAEHFELQKDESAHLSSIEWQYNNALQSFKNKAKPEIWIYRRDGAPHIAVNDPDRGHRLEQWDKLDNFLLAFDSTDGAPDEGINYYATPNNFREMFEQHLGDLLERQPGSLTCAEIPQENIKDHSLSPNIWPESPYPGLTVFTPEQAPIFFGRGEETDQLLQLFTDKQVRFVTIVGVPGAGKSSLVMAGLLPRLRTGIIGKMPWIDLSFKPGERGNNPYLALSHLLRSELDLSGHTGQNEQQYARELQADQSLVLNAFAQLLEKHEPGKELLLIIDQFEELFTQCTNDSRNDFLILLENIVVQPYVRVITTLRADFFARASENRILARLLRRDHSTFPLDPPSEGAIRQMITRPSAAAGVELEEGLVQRLLDDAGVNSDAMASIAFTLHLLYQREKNAACLTIKTYNALGGVKGVIQKCAKDALENLPYSASEVLPKLFTILIDVSEREITSCRRINQPQLQEDIKKAAEVLIEAQLLVTSEGENDQATVEIAHDCLLNSWEQLRNWIREPAETLGNRLYEKHKERQGHKTKRTLIEHDTDKLLKQLISTDELLNFEKKYLAALKRRRTRIYVSYILLVLLAVPAFDILLHINRSHYPPSLAAKARLIQLGVWNVPQPEMVTIPAGEFKMGDHSGAGEPDELPLHSVHIATAFELGKYEVTFEEYDLFAAATGLGKPYDEGWKYAENNQRGKLPVINVSWYNAVAYTAWLSEHTHLKFRLPSEAEWEYATRAGSTAPNHWSEPAQDENETACIYANNDIYECQDNFEHTAPPGSLTANSWGLHDMLGNVWEWTQDCYIDSYIGAPNDGSSRESVDDGDCSLRVIRGGSWSNEVQYLRSAYRNGGAPNTYNNNIGFRLARTL